VPVGDCASPDERRHPNARRATSARRHRVSRAGDDKGLGPDELPALPVMRAKQDATPNGGCVSFSPRAGITAIAPTRVLTGRRWPLGRGSLAGVTNDIAPGLCGSHNPRWSRLPDGRLPLPQELHKLGAAARSLLVRTTSTTPIKGLRRGCSRSERSSPATESDRAIRRVADPKAGPGAMRMAVTRWRGAALAAAQEMRGRRHGVARSCENGSGMPV
jgi:hypothetical protein